MKVDTTEGESQPGSVEMVTTADDQATAELYAQMLPTVSFDSQVLESPILS